MNERHLLITGRPGTGKTTLLKELARRFEGFAPAGFYTEEVREGGERRGFRLASLAGQQGRLADVAIRGAHRVGRYGVDLAAFELFLASLDLASTPSRLVFIDEIGKMECLSPRFVALAGELLASQKTVVATVALQGEGLIQQVKRRPDSFLVEVTVANRHTLLADLTDWLGKRLQSG